MLREWRPTKGPCSDTELIFEMYWVLGNWSWPWRLLVSATAHISAVVCACAGDIVVGIEAFDHVASATPVFDNAATASKPVTPWQRSVGAAAWRSATVFCALCYEMRQRRGCRTRLRLSILTLGLRLSKMRSEPPAAPMYNIFRG